MSSLSWAPFACEVQCSSSSILTLYCFECIGYKILMDIKFAKSIQADMSSKETGNFGFVTNMHFYVEL